MDDDVCSKLGPEENGGLDCVCREYSAASCVQTFQSTAYSKLLAHLTKDCRPIKRSLEVNQALY